MRARHNQLKFYFLVKVDICSLVEVPSSPHENLTWSSEQGQDNHETETTSTPRLSSWSTAQPGDGALRAFPLLIFSPRYRGILPPPTLAQQRSSLTTAPAPCNDLSWALLLPAQTTGINPSGPSLRRGGWAGTVRPKRRRDQQRAR